MNRFMWKAVSHSLVTHRDEAACSDQSSSTTRLARMESCSSVPSSTPSLISESSSHTRRPLPSSACSSLEATDRFLEE
jgi:hypothetical protein